MAVTVLAVSIVTEHEPLPIQALVQPAKVRASAGVAVSVRLVPESKSAAQIVPQLIPPALLITVPLGPPAFANVSFARRTKR